MWRIIQPPFFVSNPVDKSHFGHALVPPSEFLGEFLKSKLTLTLSSKNPSGEFGEFYSHR